MQMSPRLRASPVSSLMNSLLFPVRSTCSSASGAVNARASAIDRGDDGLTIVRMRFSRVTFTVPLDHSNDWRSVMTLKLLAPLALLLGLVGGGTASVKMSCCAPGADCCNPPRACCFAAATDVKAGSCCPDGDCCDPAHECCIAVNTSVKAADCCGCECCIPGAECCGPCCRK
jgi:hypothetical protein